MIEQQVIVKFSNNILVLSEYPDKVTIEIWNDKKGAAGSILYQSNKNDRQNIEKIKRFFQNVDFENKEI